MLQELLNDAMVLHIHKDFTDGLGLKSIGNDFIAKPEYQKLEFPMF